VAADLSRRHLRLDDSMITICADEDEANHCRPMRYGLSIRYLFRAGDARRLRAKAHRSARRLRFQPLTSVSLDA